MFVNINIKVSEFEFPTKNEWEVSEIQGSTVIY